MLLIQILELFRAPVPDLQFVKEMRRSKRPREIPPSNWLLSPGLEEAVGWGEVGWVGVCGGGGTSPTSKNHEIQNRKLKEMKPAIDTLMPSRRHDPQGYKIQTARLR